MLLIHSLLIKDIMKGFRTGVLRRKLRMAGVNEVRDCGSITLAILGKNNQCAFDAPNHREAVHRIQCEVGDEDGWKRRTVFGCVAGKKN